MKLYHFTAREYLSSIQKQGINKGDVPTSPNTGFNAPWLTSDPSFQRQKWTTGSVLDKSDVRLTVEIPDHDPALRYWPQYAQELGVDQWWYDALDKAAGSKSSNWHVYKGTVPPEWITDVEFSFGEDAEPEQYDSKKLHKDTVQFYFELSNMAFERAHQEDKEEARRWTPIWSHLRNTNIIEIAPATLHMLTQRVLMDLALANNLDPFRQPKDEVEDALEPIIEREVHKQRMPANWPFESLYFGFGTGSPYQRHGTIALDRVPVLHSIMVIPNGDVWAFVGHVRVDKPDVSFTVHLEREKGKWLRPDTLTAWIIPWLITYINEHQALVVDKTRSLSHKYALKNMYRRYKHQPEVPPPYYVVPISMDDVREAQDYGEEEGPGRAVDWSHRWKRRGHERVKIRRGKLPLDPKTEKRLRREWEGCKGDFEMFTTGGLSIRAAKAMAKRGIPFKRPDEWVAVLYTWIDEQVMLKDRTDLPFVPSVHAPVKQAG